MEEGTVLRWLAADGATVRAGQPVVEVETDKATMEVEAPASGVLRIVAAAGALVSVNGVLAEIAEPGEESGSREEPATPAVIAAPAEIGSSTEPARPTTVPVPRGPVSMHLPPAAVEAPIGERPNDLSREQLLSLYCTMSRIRAFEEQVVEAFNARLIPGSTHPCIGQEAIKAGAIDAIERSDLVLATYRGHGEAIAKGVEPVAIMAELMCRSTGVCKGKGGSMHLAEPSVGLVSTNAIVAGHIPMAGGVALSAKLRETGQAVLCFFGDGASCEGEFFETLNVAMLWKVPLVFVCENNGAAISVPTSKSQATPDIADRARGFGMPAEVVDGNDVLAVRRAVGGAAVRAKDGHGPSFVECKTVRWERHSAFSAGGTDQAAARAAWQRVDPLVRYRRALIEWHVAADAEMDAVDVEARAEAAQARAAAEAAPHPGPDSVYEDIFAPTAHRA
jgi:acetoin:2,6-dichlorophenolindophenol oxidoreductase subunit alpha